MAVAERERKKKITYDGRDRRFGHPIQRKGKCRKGK